MPEPVSILIVGKLALWGLPTAYKAYSWMTKPSRQAKPRPQARPSPRPRTGERATTIEPENGTSSEAYMRRARQMLGITDVEPQQPAEVDHQSLEEMLDAAGVTVLDRPDMSIFLPDPNNPAAEPDVPVVTPKLPVLEGRVELGHRYGCNTVEIKLDVCTVIAVVSADECEDMAGALIQAAQVQRATGGH